MTVTAATARYSPRHVPLRVLHFFGKIEQILKADERVECQHGAGHDQRNGERAGGRRCLNN